MLVYGSMYDLRYFRKEITTPWSVTAPSILPTPPRSNGSERVRPLPTPSLSQQTLRQTWQTLGAQEKPGILN